MIKIICDLCGEETAEAVAFDICSNEIYIDENYTYEHNKHFCMDCFNKLKKAFSEVKDDGNIK